MIKTILAVCAIALAFSACTENEKVMNHATGQYYAIDPQEKDWLPLFN